MSKRERVAIIGGGASGMAAAIFFSERGFDVTIFEADKKIGQKILVTGNGRCNLANENWKGEFYNNEEFVSSLIPRFSLEKLLEFFKSLGIETYSDNCGRVYPLSNTASSVLDAFRFKLESLGVSLKTESAVKRVTKLEDFVVFTDKEKDHFDRVVIASGGIKNDILSEFSINSTIKVPALVGLKVKESIKSLAGVRANALASLDGDKFAESGEVQFKLDGISGICIMNLSSRLAWKNKTNATINLDFLKDTNFQQLVCLLRDRREKLSYLSSEDLLMSLVHKSISKEVLRRANIQEKSIAALSDDEIERIANNLKAFSLTVCGKYENYQVLSGGYDVSEFDSHLMSKKYKNLYVIGEALNIDGLCGGYNLAFAFLSAFVTCR